MDRLNLRFLIPLTIAAYSSSALAANLEVEYKPYKTQLGSPHTLEIHAKGITKCQNPKGYVYPGVTSDGSLDFTWTTTREVTGKNSSTVECTTTSGGKLTKTAYYEITLPPQPTLEAAYSPTETLLGNSHTLFINAENVSRCYNSGGYEYPVDPQTNKLDFTWTTTRSNSGDNSSTIICEGLSSENKTIRKTAHYTILGPEVSNVNYYPSKVAIGETQSFNFEYKNVQRCVGIKNGKYNSNDYKLKPDANGSYSGSFTWQSPVREVAEQYTQTVKCFDKLNSTISSSTNNVIEEKVDIYVNNKHIISDKNFDISVANTDLDDIIKVKAHFKGNNCRLSEDPSTHLNGAKMSSNGLIHEINIKQAYLKDILYIKCDIHGIARTMRSITFSNTQMNKLEAAVSNIILNQGYPSVGGKQKNFYAEFDRLVILSKIYENIDTFTQELGIDVASRIESYMIHRIKEFWDDTCELDQFGNMTNDLVQCRQPIPFISPNSNKSWYLWNSPSSSAHHGKHWHYEWRAAAGVATAISAILTSSKSSEQSKYHARRVLNNIKVHIWDKWSDTNIEDIRYISQKPYPQCSYMEPVQEKPKECAGQLPSASSVKYLTLQNSNVAWMLARGAILGQALRKGGVNVNSASINSQLPQFIGRDFGYNVVTCYKAGKTGKCDWNGIALNGAGSGDISHAQDYMLALYNYDKNLASSLTGSLTSQAWYPYATDSYSSEGFGQFAYQQQDTKYFGKFDAFTGGYCSKTISYQDALTTYNILKNKMNTGGIKCEGEDTSDNTLENFCVAQWFFPQQELKNSSCYWASGNWQPQRNIRYYDLLGLTDRKLMNQVRDTMIHNGNKEQLLSLYMTLLTTK
ncbi:hypothetical protein AAEU29_08465 [Pseudoalteromonas sp. SSM20]|uniref:hypothetical protein n=1 Tax=Pseudoalteromonas sp. SSM20 TaxID=3139394 RepID=UPI003BACA8FF